MRKLHIEPARDPVSLKQCWSRVKAEVFVQGVHRGPTNTKLKSRCRQKFVRLQDASTGEWLTTGQGVRIACMSVTTVTINPECPVSVERQADFGLLHVIRETGH